MKIWIDGYEANIVQRLGSSQVAFELLKGLEKIDNKNDYTIFLPNSPLDDLPKERKGWRYQVLKPKRLWTRIALPFVLYSAKQKPEIFFSPSHYLPRFSPQVVKKVATIFDLSFLHFPEMFTSKDLWQLKNWTKFSIENADHLITISNFSKKDIISQYGVDQNKITVAYPGYDREKFKVQSSKFKVEETKKKYKVGDNYIIYIGTLQPRKNLIRLMEAFARIVNVHHLPGVKVLQGLHRRPVLRTLGGVSLMPGEHSSKLELVIVGKTEGEGREGWMYEETLQTPKKLGIEKNTKFLGFVTTEDLPYLLSGAKVFVLPSLWEGFGIPVLEAMACGVPVIVSNVSSLSEVVGKAGLLVDPYSIDQIEQSIRAMITDKKLHQNYSKLALIQAKKFSWEKMVLNVCLSLGLRL